MRCLAALLFCIACGLYSWQASAGPEKTTWRAGDGVRIVGFCHTHEAAAEVAVTPSIETVRALIEAGKCVSLPPAVVAMAPPVRLDQFMSHHFDPMSKKPVSVWRSGNIYLIVPDEGGPHEATRES